VIESFSGSRYANYFLHGEHLVVDGKSMSKSRGNILYPEDIYAWGYLPHHLRFFLISKHYRRKLNLTRSAFAEKARWIDGLRERVARLLHPGAAAAAPAAPQGAGTGAAAELLALFERWMNEDLWIGRALEELDGALAGIEAGASPRPRVSELRAAVERIDSVARVLL
jgi:cysteinyl-tRNA synthetase